MAQASIERCACADRPGWLALRKPLGPSADGADLSPELARRPLERAAARGRERGPRGFASETALDDGPSAPEHEARGCAQTERVVYFRKELS
jgi:hypothetical protein